MNNPDEALHYFNNRVINKLESLADRCRATIEETDPTDADDERELSRLRRMSRVCEDSAMMVELCLKALATLHGVHPPSEKVLASAGHDIEACLRLVPEEPRRAVERLIRQKRLDLASMSRWRVQSTYPDDAPVVQASADEWAEDYVWTALAVCDHTIDAIGEAAGDPPAFGTAATRWRKILGRINERDIRTGQRGTGDCTS